MTEPSPPSSRSQSSVTHWVEAEKAGRDASQKLWDRYVDDVVRACEARLPPSLRRSVSGDDLAQEVFGDFFLGLRSHAFPRLNNRRDVKQILLMLAERVTIDHRRRHGAQKAGGGRVVSFTEIARPTGDDAPAAADPAARPESPADEADVRRLLVAFSPDLADPLLQDLVCDRMMGFTVEETAARHGISGRSVIRKLQLLIRRLEARGLSNG